MLCLFGIIFRKVYAKVFGHWENRIILKMFMSRIEVEIASSEFSAVAKCVLTISLCTCN